jgi:hypothetical protein
MYARTQHHLASAMPPEAVAGAATEAGGAGAH